MPAALMQGRIPPQRGVEQDDVHGGVEHVGGQLLEPDDHRVGGERHPDPLAGPAHAVQAVDRIFEVVVVQVLDLPREPDGLLRGPDAVGIEAQAVARQRPSQGAVALQLVARREHAALELVRGESPLRFEGAGLRHQLIHRAHLAGPVPGVGVAEEQVGGERHVIAQPAAEDLGHRHAPLLPQQVQAGELDCGEHLGPQVVQRGGRVGDEEAQLFEARGVAPQEIRLQPVHSGAGALAAAPQLTEADEAAVGFDLDDGAHEAAPMTPVGVTQGRLERNGDWCGPNVGDLHGRWVIN